MQTNTVQSCLSKARDRRVGVNPLICYREETLRFEKILHCNLPPVKKSLTSIYGINYGPAGRSDLYHRANTNDATFIVIKFIKFVHVYIYIFFFARTDIIIERTITKENCSFRDMLKTFATSCYSARLSNNLKKKKEKKTKTHNHNLNARNYEKLQIQICPCKRKFMDN